MFTVIVGLEAGVRAGSPTWVSAAAVLPASTVQLSSSVAPFQLAYDGGPARLVHPGRERGLSVGWPVQSAVKAR